MAVVSRGDVAELLELVDAALDEVSLLVFETPKLSARPAHAGMA
jgi:hypothetical protein